jgi:16S rRNA (adenine1518-N6/adenine1519-N6)-dimethyltransferase
MRYGDCMLTAKEMKQLLESAGLAPRKRFGQCFLIDRNLMNKLLAITGLTGSETVLEVGPATGAMTEDLLPNCKRLVAAEIDTGLAGILDERLGHDPKLRIIVGDVLAGKHAIAPEVLDAIAPEAHLISNLPYNIATPLLAECLKNSWNAIHDRPGVRFDRMTFMIQREMADRLSAEVDTPDYGPITVLTQLLGSVRPGPVVPASAFWPAPKVQSQIVRVDFDPDKARELKDMTILTDLLSAAFGQRRKQIGTVFRKASLPYAPDALAGALHAAGVTPDQRAQTVRPGQFGAMANALVQ